MSKLRGERADQAVRPVDVQDVENEGGDQEEELRGEEPLEVDMHGAERRRGGEKEKEEEEKPQRMVPEEGAERRMRNIGDPRLPTKAEVDAHNVTHVPYRNWCPHCVRGRGKDLDHRRSADEDRRVR